MDSAKRLCLVLLLVPVFAHAYYPWPTDGSMRCFVNHSSDYDWFKANGLKSVRWQIMGKLNEAKHKGNEADYQRRLSGLFQSVAEARQRGLYCVIATLACGYSSDFFGTNGDNYGGAFKDESKIKAWLEVWKDIASHFADSGDGFAFQPGEEPWGSDANNVWKILAKRVTDTIRAYDTMHPIVMAAPEWSSPRGYYYYMEPTGDENTVYQHRFYAPKHVTHDGGPWDKNLEESKEAARAYVEMFQVWAQKYNVKPEQTWIGEFGVSWAALNNHIWLQGVLETFMEYNYTGWCYYTYKQQGWQVLNIEKDPDLMALFLDYSNRPLNTSSIEISGHEYAHGGVVVRHGRSMSAQAYDIVGRRLGRKNSAVLVVLPVGAGTSRIFFSQARSGTCH